MMNEIPRIQHNPLVTVSAPSQVAPARPVADRTQSIQENSERRRRNERRKRNTKPAVDRRTSSDRRAPRFDAKA